VPACLAMLPGFDHLSRGRTVVCLLSDSTVLGMNTIKTVFRKCR